MKFALLILSFLIVMAPRAYALEPSCSFYMELLNKAPRLSEALEKKRNFIMGWRINRAWHKLDPENFNTGSSSADVKQVTENIYRVAAGGLWPDDQEQVRANLWIEQQVFAEGLTRALMKAQVHSPGFIERARATVNDILWRPVMNVLAITSGVKRLSDRQASARLINEILEDGYEKHQVEILAEYQKRGQGFWGYFTSSLRIALLAVNMTAITSTSTHIYFDAQVAVEQSKEDSRSIDNKIATNDAFIKQLQQNMKHHQGSK